MSPGIAVLAAMIFGLFIGAIIGITVMALLFVAKQADQQAENQQGAEKNQPGFDVRA